MGTLNAIYVRVDDPAHVAALRSAYPTAHTEPGMRFYEIPQPKARFKPPENELVRLSTRLDTDVLWLGFQSVVDLFQFQHWRSGQQLRALVYGEIQERIWERVEGQPEPWEIEAFFKPERLRSALEDMNSEEAAELEHIWQARELLPGRFDPSHDARESAREVAKFYRLPGWGLEPTS